MLTFSLHVPSTRNHQVDSIEPLLAAVEDDDVRLSFLLVVPNLAESVGVHVLEDRVGQIGLRPWP